MCELLYHVLVVVVVTANEKKKNNKNNTETAAAFALLFSLRSIQNDLQNGRVCQAAAGTKRTLRAENSN